MNTRRRLLGIAVLLMASPAQAQVSLVPPDHPVYEWLARQRAAGRVPSYRHEALPAGRGEIVQWLANVGERGGMNGVDARLLLSYQREFATPTNQRPVTLTQGGAGSVAATVRQKVNLLFSDSVPHLFQYVHPDGNATVDYEWGVGTFRGGEGAGIDDAFDRFDFQGFRLYGTAYGVLGAHIEGINPFGADAIRFHPQWAKTGDILYGNGGATLFGQGSISLVYRALRLDIGSGPVHIGGPGSESPVLDRYSAAFDWVRVAFATRHVDYTYLHGALTGPGTTTALPSFPDSLTRTAFSRWMVAHRLAVRPTRWLQLGFSELIAYSNRGVDFTYLNPVYPLRLSESNNGERDNWVVYLDGILRPVNGVEVFGVLGLDDVSQLSDLFKPTGSRSKNDSTTKVLAHGGVTIAVPTGTDIGVEFTRVEPFFYTHRYPLNGFNQHGFALGSSVGPNGDRVLMRARQWLPWRGWVGASLAWSRQGLNPVDSTGAMIVDVGGSIASSSHQTERILFLAGDLHRTRTLRVEAAVEPWRGVRGEVVWERVDVREGTRLLDRNVLRLMLFLNWYPLQSLMGVVGL